MTGKTCAAALLLAGLWTNSAQAAFVVSTAATSNVSCSSGVCSATATNAVLNAHDLDVSLAHGDTTLASGSTAQDIEFDTPVHWTSAHRLTLDSYRSITFTQPVMSEGIGGITITTNNGGTGGDFIFTGKGRVAFWNLSSSLIINGSSYMLAGNIATLASDIATNPSGAYALANNYDASVDGTYTHSPISAPDFGGAFEGLGNTISHLTISTSHGGALFAVASTLRDIVLNGESMRSSLQGGEAAGLVGENHGVVIGTISINGRVSGGSSTTMNGTVGGLVAVNYGAISRSHVVARVTCTSFCSVGGLVGVNVTNGQIGQSDAGGSVAATSNSVAGGLVGRNESGANITQSFSTANVSVGSDWGHHDIDHPVTMAGGFVGENSSSSIDQSYATGNVSGGSGLSAGDYVWVGGFVGVGTAPVQNSYATGAVSVGSRGIVGGFAGGGILGDEGIIKSYSVGKVSATGTSAVGGFIGADFGNPAPNASTYWDLDTSGISNPNQGAGNKANDPGITGLTTAQLQSGLPSGFDPTVWGESPGINNGLPYLLALRP